MSLVLFVVTLSGHVFACECAIWCAERACPLMNDPAEVLFVGTVVATDGQQIGMARFTFQVDESLSGTSTKEVDVYSYQGCCACGINFKVGERWLVDGWRGKDGRIATGYCEKTRLFRDSDPLMAELWAIREGKKPDSLFGVLRHAPGPWGDGSEGADFPLSGVTIRVRSETQEFETKSDSGNVYRFRELPPGKYSLSADLPISLTLGDPWASRPNPPFSIVANACGEFNPRVLTSGRITGRVVNQSGNPVQVWVGSDVQLIRSDGYQENPSEYTKNGTQGKQQGYFVFNFVAPGDYIAVYNPHNYHSKFQPFPRTFYPSARDAGHATRIHIAEGETVSDIVIHVAAATVSQRGDKHSE